LHSLNKNSAQTQRKKMDTLSYKTISANAATADKKWVLIDAENQVVGRLSVAVANILRGKNKVNFTPHADCGDYVVIINAEKIRFTGSKLTDKKYVRHTGYPGGQRFATPKEMLNRKPFFILEHAIKGMLPKNKLGSKLYTNLHVYVGTEHPHQAQQPILLDINTIL